MSFSNDVKRELTEADFASESEVRSELIGLLITCGAIHCKAEKPVLQFSTESNPVTRRLFRLIKKLTDVDPCIEVSERSTLSRRKTYRVVVEERGIVRILGPDRFHEALKLGAYRVPESIVSTNAKKKAFLRGGFLGAGSVSDPSKTYHLEIVSKSREDVDVLCYAMNSFSLGAKHIERKGSQIAYLKDSEKIADFLTVVGAHRSLLEFENIRVLKDVRNNVNRVVNCETANMDKVLDASFRQQDAIRKIDETVGLSKLSENLREIATLRMKYPEDSLTELGKKLTRPLGKSGVNHRLKKIIEIADKIG